jgi:hypothetical protein
MIFEPLRTKGLNALCVFESQPCVTASSPEQTFSQQILRTHEKHTSQNESRMAKNEPRREVKSNSKERSQLRRRHKRPYLLREQTESPTTKRTSLSSTTNERATPISQRIATPTTLLESATRQRERPKRSK